MMGENKHTRPAVNQPLGNQHARYDSLCESCNGIDLLSFFDPKDDMELEVDFSVQNTSCPLCMYVADRLKYMAEEFEDYVFDYENECNAQLCRVALDPIEYLQQSDCEVFCRMEVAVRDTKSKVYRSICVLELCEGHRRAQSKYRMLRTPIPHQFDATVLKVWLQQSAEGGSSFENQQSIDAFSRLLAQRRFRVIDVATGEVIVLSKYERFVALSYVWGEAMRHYVASSSISKQSACDRPGESWKPPKQTHLRSLPQTIQDAANLVQQIGERFLWVDALCIDQTDKVDKSAVISAMNSIYKAAYFTLVAADGDGADAGLSRLKPSSQAEDPLTFTWQRRRLSVLPHRPPIEDCANGSIWNERAWTFQERLVSSRCLFFTQDEVCFTGPSFNAREAYAVETKCTVQEGAGPWTSITDMTLRKFLDTPRSLSHRVFRGRSEVNYYNAVMEYTGRELTYSGDRLDAFEGILDHVYPNDLAERDRMALSGLLPGRQFFNTLCWAPADDSHEVPNRQTQNTTKTRALPSWSWTSISVPVYLCKRQQLGPVAFLPEIIDSGNIKCVPTAFDRREQWPLEPPPCAIDGRQHVILHLWRPIFKCKLRTDEYWNNMCSNSSCEALHHYNVFWTDSEMQTYPVGEVRVAPRHVSVFGKDHLFDVMSISRDTVEGGLFLLQQSGDFFIKVSGGTNRFYVIDEDEYMKHFQYIRLR